MTVLKAVIPAAGLGTRFLPATKAQPKEMMPIVDKPAIQYVVEETVGAGIKDILIVTGRGKRSLADHFDRSFELEYYLKQSGKLEQLQEILKISEIANFYFARQPEPLGLGHAISVSEKFVENSSFAVLLADDLMATNSKVLSEMVKLHNDTNKVVLALKEVKKAEVPLYGCVDFENTENKNLVIVKQVVEKPSVEDAPSNLAIMGRYIFNSDIFGYLKKVVPGKSGEIQLTDAISYYLNDHEVLGYIFTSERYDIGNKIEYLRTNIEFALQREDLRDEFLKVLAEAAEKYLH